MKKAIILGVIFLFLMSGLQARADNLPDFDLISPQELAREIKNPNSERAKAALMLMQTAMLLSDKLSRAWSTQLVGQNESRVKNFVLEYKINESKQHPETAWIYSPVINPSLIDFKKMEDFVVSRSFNLIRFKQGIETLKRALFDLVFFVRDMVDSTEVGTDWTSRNSKKIALECLAELLKQIEKIDPDLFIQGGPLQRQLKSLPEEVRELVQIGIRIKGIDALLALWMDRAEKLYCGSWHDSRKKIELALEALGGVVNSDIREDPERFKKLTGPLMKEIENGIDELSRDIANLQKK